MNVNAICFIFLDDVSIHNILDGLAVGACHRRYLLAKQTTPFVNLGLVAALPTAIFQFPSHCFVFYLWLVLQT